MTMPRGSRDKVSGFISRRSRNGGLLHGSRVLARLMGRRHGCGNHGGLLVGVGSVRRGNVREGMEE